MSFQIPPQISNPFIQPNLGNQQAAPLQQLQQLPQLQQLFDLFQNLQQQFPQLFNPSQGGFLPGFLPSPPAGGAGGTQAAAGTGSKDGLANDLQSIRSELKNIGEKYRDQLDEGSRAINRASREGNGLEGAQQQRSQVANQAANEMIQVLSKINPENLSPEAAKGLNSLFREVLNDLPRGARGSLLEAAGAMAQHDPRFKPVADGFIKAQLVNNFTQSLIQNMMSTMQEASSYDW
jgi:hypothetical protein